ncbi:MAG TPA: DUF4149 domain-containing protein [Candidatus Baltobacteraceae bacterium]
MVQARPIAAVQTRSVAIVQRIATITEVLALGLWIGALCGFAFVFAPVAFHTLPDLNVFANLIARTVLALTHLGYGLGAIALLAALTRGARIRAVAITTMIALSFYHTHFVMHEMEATLHTFNGSIAQTPKTDPRRTRYDAEHQWSTRVYGTVVLLGLIALGAASQPTHHQRAKVL